MNRILLFLVTLLFCLLHGTWAQEPFLQTYSFPWAYQSSVPAFSENYYNYAYPLDSGGLEAFAVRLDGAPCTWVRWNQHGEVFEQQRFVIADSLRNSLVGANLSYQYLPGTGRGYRPGINPLKWQVIGTGDVALLATWDSANQYVDGWQLSYFDPVNPSVMRQVRVGQVVPVASGGAYVMNNASNVIHRIDANGSLAWSKQVPQTFGAQNSNIFPHPDGGVMLASAFYDFQVGQFFYLKRWDEHDSLVWDYAYQLPPLPTTNQALFQASLVDSSGNIHFWDAERIYSVDSAANLIAIRELQGKNFDLRQVVSDGTGNTLGIGETTVSGFRRGYLFRMIGLDSLDWAYEWDQPWLYEDEQVTSFVQAVMIPNRQAWLIGRYGTGLLMKMDLYHPPDCYMAPDTFRIVSVNVGGTVRMQGDSLVDFPFYKLEAVTLFESDSSADVSLRPYTNQLAADFTYSTLGSNVRFVDLSDGIGPEVDETSDVPHQWTWDFGDGVSSIQRHPVHRYLGAGTYTVCLTLSDRCDTVSICKEITIAKPDSLAYFEVPNRNNRARFLSFDEAGDGSLYYSEQGGIVGRIGAGGNLLWVHRLNPNSTFGTTVNVVALPQQGAIVYGYNNTDKGYVGRIDEMGQLMWWSDSLRFIPEVAYFDRVDSLVHIHGNSESSTSLTLSRVFDTDGNIVYSRVVVAYSRDIPTSRLFQFPNNSWLRYGTDLQSFQNGPHGRSISFEDQAGLERWRYMVFPDSIIGQPQTVINKLILIDVLPSGNLLWKDNTRIACTDTLFNLLWAKRYVMIEHPVNRYFTTPRATANYPYSAPESTLFVGQFLGKVEENAYLVTLGTQLIQIDSIGEVTREIGTGYDLNIEKIGLRGSLLAPDSRASANGWLPCNDNNLLLIEAREADAFPYYTQAITVDTLVNDTTGFPVNNILAVGPVVDSINLLCQYRNHRLSGQILTSSSLPLDSSIVLLVYGDIQRDTVFAIDTALTDAQGRFELLVFDSLPPIYLKAIPDLVQHPNQLPTYYTGVAVIQQASSILVDRDIELPVWNTLLGTNPGGPGFMAGYISQGAGKRATGPKRRSYVLTDSIGTPLMVREAESFSTLSFGNLPAGRYQIWVDWPTIDNAPGPKIWLHRDFLLKDSLNLVLYSDRLELVCEEAEGFQFEVIDSLVRLTYQGTLQEGYDWSFGDGNTGEGSEVDHVYTITGSYQVRLITFNDCGEDTFEQTIFVQVSDPSSIENQVEANEITVYPNPANNHLTLALAAAGESLSIVIYNVNGQALKTWQYDQAEKVTQLDVSALPAGVVFLRIQSSQGTFNKMLLIE